MPPVQFEKVLPVMIFVGAPPSVVVHPVIVVAPVTVIPEKLFPVAVLKEPATELALEV